MILGNKNKGNGTMMGAGNGTAAIITTSELREIRNKTEKGQKADSTIIDKSDLERMKGSTKILTKEQ